MFIIISYSRILIGSHYNKLDDKRIDDVINICSCLFVI